MELIKGIFAASISIINEDMSLNIEKTIVHAENLIESGCHGVVFFGSTGQSQLISIIEKNKLVKKLSSNKYLNNYIIGTGCNSLLDNINLMRTAIDVGLDRFLIMPPAYYKYEDKNVIEFYSKIINELNYAKIILYNFEKLSGYKFTLSCVEELVSRYPEQIIGIKDSSYNLYEILKIKNFSVFPGSETKLLKGLEIGCAGIISATCNVTSRLSREVFENFFSGVPPKINMKLCSVRKIFEKYNLISGLHSFLSQIDKSYSYILPPLKVLNMKDQRNLIEELKKIGFSIKFKEAV